MYLLAALGLTLLGIGILLALRQLYAQLRVAAGDVVVLAASIVGWSLVFFGLSIAATPVGMIFVLLIFGMTVAKYRNGERRALLWTLALTAEKGLPLAPAARAFASRRCDEMARRAWMLADLLDQGLSLSESLRQSGNPLPTEANLMVRLGTDSLSTPRALRESAEYGQYSDEAWRPVFEQTLYLLWVAISCIVVTAFIMIKIFPTYREILNDFGLRLPGYAQFLVESSNFISRFSFLLIPLGIYFVVVTLVAAYFYAQGKIWLPPPLGWLFGRSENPTVLRGLAICLEQQLPIDQALYTLAHHYPLASVRSRLARSVVAASRGEDWSRALADAQIITKSELALIRAANRAGNLVWSLRELSEIGHRRMVFRAKRWLSIVTPVCLLCVAVPVGVLALGCITPLVSVIEEAARAGH